MDFDISGAQVFFTIPTNIPILGDLQISEDYGGQLDCHGSYCSALPVADT